MADKPPTAAEFNSAADAALLKVLKDGKKVVVKDEDGNPVIENVDPPANYIQLGYERAEKLKAEAAAGNMDVPTGPSQQLLEHARKRMAARGASPLKLSSPPPADDDRELEVG